MTSHPENKTVFTRLAAEHDSMIDIEVGLKQIRFHVERKAGMPDLKPVIVFLSVSLPKHLELEERFLFPAALMVTQSVETVRLILTLQEAHGRLRCQAESLIGELTEDKIDQEKLKGGLLDRLDSFTSLFQEHMEIESKQLFPKLNSGPKVTEMIRSLLKAAA